MGYFEGFSSRTASPGNKLYIKYILGENGISSITEWQFDDRIASNEIRCVALIKNDSPKLIETSSLVAGWNFHVWYRQKGETVYDPLIPPGGFIQGEPIKLFPGEQSECFLEFKLGPGEHEFYGEYRPFTHGLHDITSVKSPVTFVKIKGTRRSPLDWLKRQVQGLLINI